MPSSSRLKSQVWLHFATADAEKKVKCLYCGRKLSIANKSTCSLIRHIKKKHPSKHIARQEHPEQGSNNVLQTDAQPPPAAADVTNAAPSRLISNVPKTKTKKDQLFYIKATSTKTQKQIDRQLVSMITKEYHSFRMVEDKEFVKLINLLNPVYKLPTRKTLSRSLIPAIYKKTVEKVKRRLKRASAVCLTVDGWTSRTQESFYAVTAHYIVENNDGMVLDSDLLKCLSFADHHTSENISNKFKDIMTEWQIDNKVILIVSDNAPNMNAAVRLGEWRHWACFARSLNRISLAGLEEIQVVIDKIRAIVSYFKKSSQATAQLAATQKDLPHPKLKSDVPTIWNSTFDMINSILSVKNAVVSTLAVLKPSSIVQYADIEEPDVLTPNEWFIAEQAVQVLEVFYALTSVITSENEVTLSSITIYLKQLITQLHTCEINRSNLMPEVNNMVARLLRELNSQFYSERDHIEDNYLIGLSTILDPRYKKFGFIDETKYRDMLEKLYTEVASVTITATCVNTSSYENVTNHDTTSYTNKLDSVLFETFDNAVQEYLKPVNPRASAVIEVDKYLEEPLLPRKDANGVNTDPLIWWFQRKHVYPRLTQLVKTRLSIVATSVPSERIFSRAGHIVKEKRENFKASKVSKVVFLNYNLNRNA